MENDNDAKPLYTIRIAAELIGCHPQTLRTYEEKGFIEPYRTEGQTRIYSKRDLDKTKQVQALIKDGISSSGVFRVLEMQKRIDELESAFELLIELSGNPPKRLG